MSEVSNNWDFFISYNQTDKDWAEWIAWQLEKAGYSTFIQAWDFRVGGNFVLDSQKATTLAKRTIMVLSPDYLETIFISPEWAVAFNKDPAGLKGLLLPVVVRPCQPVGFLAQLGYIDLSLSEEEQAREELLSKINASRAKPLLPPLFPEHSLETSGLHKPHFPGGPLEAEFEAALQREDWDTVILQAKRILLEDSGSLSARHFLTRATLARGEHYLNEGKLELAIKDFTLALELDQPDHRTLKLRGLAYQASLQYQQALLDFSSAINQVPTDSSLYLERARIQNSLDNEPGYQADLKKASELGSREAQEELSTYQHVLALIAGFEQADDKTRAGIKEELKLIGEPAFLPLVQALKHNNKTIRYYAAQTLGTFKNPKIQQPLLAAFDATDFNLALQIIFAIAQSGDEAAPNIILERSKRGKVEGVSLDDLIVRALVDIGTGAVDPLISALKENNPTPRPIAYRALLQLGPVAEEKLVAALTSSEKRVRFYASAILMARGNILGIQSLLSALKEPDKELQLLAASLLGKGGDQRAVDPLIQALLDEDFRVSLAAANSLGELKDPRAIEPLIQLLTGRFNREKGKSKLPPWFWEQGFEVKQAAAQALGKIGEPALKPLLLELKKESVPVSEIPHALGYIGKPALEPLIKILEEPSDYMRANAYRSLGYSQLPEALPYLLKGLQDRDKDGRFNCALVLGQYNEKRVVKALIVALKDKEPQVREAAIISLGKLGDPEALPELENLTKDYLSKAMVNVDIRKTALEAIQKIKQKDMTDKG